MFGITDDEIIQIASDWQDRVDKLERKFGHQPPDSGPQKMKARIVTRIDDILAEADKPISQRNSKWKYIHGY